MKNCTHEDCIDKEWYPALLKRDEKGNLDTFYCNRECKANVVMVDYKADVKPRTPKEMQYRINRMKEEFIERQKGQKKLL